MTNLKKALLLGASVAILGIGAASAGDSKKHEAKMAEKFAAMDVDGNGTISEAEYLAHKTEKARKHFSKVSGGDGELTLEEAKEARKKRYEKKKKMRDHG